LSLIKKIIVNLIVFFGLSIGGGLGSAWYMIEAGSRLSTRSNGPWVTWSAAGRPDADPYTRAHMVRDSLLPLSSTLELSYRAKTDSAGGRLRSGCDYTITLTGFDGAWWNLAAFDSQGRLIANPAERYAFNRDNVMREPDGRAIVSLARDARSGNWLPIGSSRFTLILSIDDPTQAARVYESGISRPLPEIKRIACR
jgi:hypothetical protein